MEASNNHELEYEYPFKKQSNIIFSQLPQKTHKKSTTKSLTQFGAHSKSRIRRINSIEQNMTALFKQNQAKLHLYLRSESLISDTITSLNLQNPQTSSTLSDGVYVLIQGSIKMITFEENRQLAKSAMKEITTNIFRKLRIQKQLGNKVREPGSDYIKKYPINDKALQFYILGTFQQPFSLFECINQNCCCFSSDTILYKLDENEIRIFKYYQNKQKLTQLLSENRPFFNTHSMLYQSFIYKKFNFRNQFKVDNVALIKKGTIRVFLKNDSETYQKGNPKSSKQFICQLCQTSLLVKGYNYEISSYQAEIVFVEINPTFQFIKNPEWVTIFEGTMNPRNQQKPQKRNTLKKRSTHLKIRTDMHKFSYNQFAINGSFSIQQPQQNNLNLTSCQNYSKIVQKSPLLKESNHRKSISDLNQNQKTNQTSYIKQLLSQKSKKTDIIKLLSPYVLISHKMGLKEATKTRSILNEKSLNLSPLKLNATKVSKNHLKKYQTHSFELLQKPLLTNKPYDRKTLLKFEKFLQQENLKQYEKKLKQKHKFQQQNHKKSSSELVPITSSNFHLSLSLKRNFSNTLHTQLDGKRDKLLRSKLQIGKLTFCI